MNSQQEFYKKINYFITVNFNLRRDEHGTEFLLHKGNAGRWSQAHSGTGVTGRC
jgi:hypothetical protein